MADEVRDLILMPGHDKYGMTQIRKARGCAFTKARRQRFLDALALTCNVSRAVAHAGVTTSTVYRCRDRDPAFADQWRAALEIGYDRLETLLLEHGGAGVAIAPIDPARAEADGVPPPFDFDKAVKVLQLHRAMRDRKPTHGRRRRATREETNVALMKALAAAARRMEKARGPDA